MAGEQLEELIGRRRAVEGLYSSGNRPRIRDDLLLRGLRLLAIVRETRHDDVPYPEDVADPQIAQRILRSGDFCRHGRRLGWIVLGRREARRRDATGRGKQ